jgi:hypothetical protein
MLININTVKENKDVPKAQDVFASLPCALHSPPALFLPSGYTSKSNSSLQPVSSSLGATIVVLPLGIHSLQICRYILVIKMEERNAHTRGPRRAFIVVGCHVGGGGHTKSLFNKKQVKKRLNKKIFT